MNTQTKIKIIKRGLKDNLSHSEIASMLDMTRQAVFGYIKRYGLKNTKEKKINKFKQFVENLT